MPFLRPAPDRLGPDGRPPESTPATGYPEGSADDLSSGVGLVGLTAAAAAATWALDGVVWFFLLVLGVGLVGVALLARGVHRLAGGVDQVLRQRLGAAPSAVDAASPWAPDDAGRPR